MTDAWGQQPQQQWGPPQGQPQGQPAPGWGPPPGQPQQQGYPPQGPPPGFGGPAQGQQAGGYATPDFGAEDFFKRAGSLGGGAGGPSFKWDNVIGAGILGLVVKTEVVPKTVMGVNGQPPTQKYDKNGKPMFQLRILLQTDLRGWQGVSSIPKVATPNGGEVDAGPETDTGLRVIYAWYTLSHAIEKAVQAASLTAVQIGWELGARVTEVEGTGNNAVRKYEAVHRPPTGAVKTPLPQGDGVAPAPVSQGQPAQGYTQQVQTQPTQGYAPPAQAAPQGPPPGYQHPAGNVQPGGPQGDPWAVPQGGPADAGPGPAF